MHFDLMELHDELVVQDYKDLLVLDGDWLVFKAMSAAEVETEWDSDVWTLECDHKLAKEILDEDIKSWVTRRARWKNAKVVLAFSDGRNWRKELVDPTYKQNRKSVRKPVGYKAFLQKIMDGEDYMTVSEPMLEADDVIGIIASGKNKGKTEVRYVKEDRLYRTLWECILSVADKAGMSEKEVIQQGRLARILRFNEYDIEQGTIRLWIPALSSL